jgi:hypothetical protein
VVLNDSQPPSSSDPSMAANRRELAARCTAPILAHVAWAAESFSEEVDWLALAATKQKA